MNLVLTYCGCQIDRGALARRIVLLRYIYLKISYTYYCHNHQSTVQALKKHTERFQPKLLKSEAIFKAKKRKLHTVAEGFNIALTNAQDSIVQALTVSVRPSLKPIKALYQISVVWKKNPS